MPDDPRTNPLAVREEDGGQISASFDQQPHRRLLLSQRRVEDRPPSMFIVRINGRGVSDRQRTFADANLLISGQNKVAIDLNDDGATANDGDDAILGVVNLKRNRQGSVNMGKLTLPSGGRSDVTAARLDSN